MDKFVENNFFDKSLKENIYTINDDFLYKKSKEYE